MSNGPKVINSINKAIDILELLHADDDGFTVSEISAALDLGVSSTYHILNTMKSRGFIDQDKRTKRYSLGKGIYSLCYQKTPCRCHSEKRHILPSQQQSYTNRL